MIEFIVICSFAFYGFKVAQVEGMVFYNLSIKLDNWFDAYYTYDLCKDAYVFKRPAWIRALQYPLYACPKCMPSIWGTAAYWVSYWDNSNPVSYLVLMWLLSILAMVGVVNVLMYQFPIEDD